MADENPVVEPVEHAPPLWAVLQQAMDGFVAWLQESGSWLTESTKNNSMLGAIVIMGLITTVPSLFERPKNKADPNGTRVNIPVDLSKGGKSSRSLHARRISLPSAPYARKLRRLVQHRAKSYEDGNEQRTQGLRKWSQHSKAMRRMLIDRALNELVHAVSEYIGHDRQLLTAICPEIGEGVLEEDGGLEALVDICRGRKFLDLPLPKRSASPDFDKIQAYLKPIIDKAPKAEREDLHSFLTSFRQLSMISCSLRLAEDSSSGATTPLWVSFLKSGAWAIAFTALLFLALRALS